MCAMWSCKVIKLLPLSQLFFQIHIILIIQKLIKLFLVLTEDSRPGIAYERLLWRKRDHLVKGSWPDNDSACPTTHLI